MTLYRVMAGEGVAWITGASSGIGRELTLQMARRGYTVAATARGEDKLQSLADGTEGMNGSIHPFACDVTDREAMAELVDRIESEVGPIRLAVFNAGNYFPTHGEAMKIENFVKTYQINVFGVLNGLVPLIERMKAAGRGQVVLVGSVSGYSGLPAASAYGASKAALTHMAESLLFDFEKMNIRIQIVNPGFIDTPLTEKNDFAMPALMPVEKAVDQMIAGIEGGGFEITFPRRFTYTLKFLRMLPHPVYFWLMKRMTGWHKRQLDFRDTTPAAQTRTG
ncbi:SDR family NAD(P)-dependent oxidoreductase [Oricola cellulosilytica]|uniref:SDR family NAD(P)-dependent oxidoreductase n=1 Tax=Oricola cellulosilytica TaxID=1429082 RepID=A0A4R0P8M9_9HYPH|nr:SDR family NAD(P)-dependent oxidoreductase [Oricola cellulosilytica]TCD12331.1 SDR family NAD(P)-dependent oxidoreductase [Oricola cellulosilytica]